MALQVKICDPASSTSNLETKMRLLQGLIHINYELATSDEDIVHGVRFGDFVER